jgi:glycine betaine catabolism B
VDDVTSLGVPAEASGYLALTCIGVRVETQTIKTFKFQADDTSATRHEAGQAVTLALDVDGETLYRTFSLSSAPSPDRTIEMTVKAHPAGRATVWMHETIRPGTILRSGPARGGFTLARRGRAKLAFVSGGSGATPLMAMLRYLAAHEPNADVAWFHAARNPAEVLFSAELARLQERMPALSVSVTVSQPGPGGFGLRGRLSRRMLSVAIADYAQRDVFCCGPSSFMDEAKLSYMAEGGRKDAFHTEAFGSPTASAASSGPAVEATDAPSFQLRVGDRLLQVRGDETVLQAALRQGVVIPCGCGQGLCGTCRVMRVSGTVDMHHQGGLAAEEEQSGYILACSTRLRSDAEIRLSSA